MTTAEYRTRMASGENIYHAVMVSGSSLWIAIGTGILALMFGGYVAYTDYLFDSSLRHRARGYEATGHWTDSWNFTAGASLSVSF